LDINIIDQENCKKEFDAVLTYEELKPHFEKALLEYRKKAQIPGFRKGKVPLDMVRKLYWDAVEYSALEEIANEVFKNHLLENNIPIFGTGSLLDLDYKPKEKLTIKISFEVIPAVELKQIKDIELTKTKYVIDDTLVDEELQYMKLKNATYELDGKALDDNYMVTLNTEEIDEAGSVVEGRSQKDVKLFIGSEYLSKEYYDGIKGIKENEERTIDTKNEQGEPVKIKLVCTKVEKIIYPEINEETIAKMTGKDDIKTEEALRVFLKDEIGKAYNDHEYTALKNKVVSEVVKLNDLEIPESYVEDMLNDYYKSYKEEHKGHDHDINEEEFKKKNRAEVAFTGKWFLIKDKIIHEEKIEVNDDDVRKFAEEAGKPYNLPADKMYEIYKDNKEVRLNIIDKKVIDFLVDNAKVTEIEEVKKSIKKLAEDKKHEAKKDKKKESSKAKKEKE
jgi:trigger factor